MIVQPFTYIKAKDLQEKDFHCFGSDMRAVATLHWGRLHRDAWCTAAMVKM